METPKQALKSLRKAFRKNCLLRDLFLCKVCHAGPSEFFDVHHIIDRHELENDGYTEDNGITLCKYCHIKAEKYHITGGLEWVEGYHPDDLFKAIGSSKEKAIESSKKL